MLDYDWDDLSAFIGEQGSAHDIEQTHNIVAFAVENYAMLQPQVGPLLNRLVSAAGGASLAALRELFWQNLGTDAELDQVLTGLLDRALIDFNPYQQRVVLHPVVRGYLQQNAVMLGEEWDRSHASYYVTSAQRYQYLPQERWPEIDADWGNIYMAADWCAARVNRLWQADPLELLADPSIDNEPVTWPAAADEYLDDLRLARSYALALAYYAFWRHPLGILRWLAAGALASLSLKDVRDYAWLQTNIGRQLFFHGQVDAAILWLERGRDAFDRQDLMSELAYVYTDLGTSLRILGKPRRALEYFVAAFESVAQTGDQRGMTTAFMNLGSAYYSLEDYEHALGQHRKALRIALRLQDDHSAASAYNNMGLAMEALDRPEEAARAYEYALDLFRRIDDVTGISACFNNLGSACYARSDFGQALTWYELDLSLSEKRGNWTDMAATLHNLGHVALEQDTTDLALSYFRQSRDLYAAFELTEYVREEEAMIEYIDSQENRS
jgi:tetratricopeptide (TPR) repeat protein